MSAEIFLDSNVLIYLFDNTDDAKRNRASHLIDDALRTRNAIVSFQVVQETLNILTHKLSATASQASRWLSDVLEPLWHVMPSAALYRNALDIQARYRYGFYDALIVAAALEAGCKRLYSEDLHDGQRIGSLRIENPFRES